MPAGTKIYFASDFHLGVPNAAASLEREKQLVTWLDSIKPEAAELYLMGDVFDFWFEYKTVVPRGYVRFFGKLAELADAGVKLYFFKGNHDMWMFNYFEKEFNAVIISDQLVIERSGKRFFLHHGDGLGSGDEKYKLLKRFFRSGFCQWLFARLHPNFAIGIANNWSSHSRIAKRNELKSDDSEANWARDYSQQLLQTAHYDYIIFGHRHWPLNIKIENGPRYINLGSWLGYQYSYAVFDGSELTLHYLAKE